MKRLTTLLALLVTPSTCFAFGWHDYTLDIGDGYEVFRANNMDVCISKTNGSTILYPENYDHVGPVIRYITTPEYILTKNLGRKPRNLFEGDEFQEVDASREFYFIITKGSDTVRGPFSEVEFSQQPDVSRLGQLEWKTPQNPSFWGPLFAEFLFFYVMVPIMTIVELFGP